MCYLENHRCPFAVSTNERSVAAKPSKFVEKWHSFLWFYDQNTWLSPELAECFASGTRKAKRNPQVKRTWKVGTQDLGEGLWKTEEAGGCRYWPVGFSQQLHLAHKQENACFDITSIYLLHYNSCQDLKCQDMAGSMSKMTKFFLTLTFSNEML